MERALESFGPCMVTTYPRSCSCWGWYCDRTERCTGVHYKSLVELDEQVDEQTDDQTDHQTNDQVDDQVDEDTDEQIP